MGWLRLGLPPVVSYIVTGEFKPQCWERVWRPPAGVVADWHSPALKVTARLPEIWRGPGLRHYQLASGCHRWLNGPLRVYGL